MSSKQWSVGSKQWVWGITAVALLLRLINLGAHSFWFDEGREVVRLLTPWPDVLWVSQGPDPPVYRLLLFPIGLATTHEFWLRLPSAVLGAAAVFLAYVWLCQLGQPRLGLITAVLLAFAPVQIYYAQEVSQYSLTVLLALLLLIVFERAARNGHGWDWVWLTAVILLALYSYYGLAWFLPVLDLDLAWRTWQQRSRQRVLGFVVCHVFVVLGLVALYFLLLAEQFSQFAAEKNLAPTFTNMAFWRNLDDQLFNGFIRFFTIPYSPTAPSWIGWFFVILMTAGAVLLWRQGLRQLVILLATAVLTMYLAFGWGLYLFGDRYALWVSPLFYVMIAAVLVWLWQWRWGTAVVLGTFIFLLFVAFWPNLRLIPNPWLQLPREELRPVVEYMQTQLQPDDFVYVYYGAVPAYQVYGRDIGNPTEYGIWFRGWPSQEKIADIQQAAGEASRLWLVMSHIALGEDHELINGLREAGYAVMDAMDRENATAVLLVR